ncbi:hypothetical protein UFOVP816_37 [uncultured Caudovirales phage]|uniref:DUF7695 domain-containing protein n=1 Tax=uncultured Caudovirales phage TaxID=2100421 RepID=A0A6J5P579_9CAUD|nr:hypothetical protein UFOVP816_37 [uncultured Caudovirales phage]
MKNRAKCKKCQSIIESFYDDDFVTCKCSAIYVDGGNAMRCGADSWDNFLRVDDNGNEIVPKIQSKENTQAVPKEPGSNKPTKGDLRNILKEMIAEINKLPTHVMTQPITHYDYVSLLLFIESVLEASD